MIVIFPPTTSFKFGSWIEEKHTNWTKTTHTSSSHSTQICSHYPTFLPEFPQQCKSFLPTINDLIVSFRDSQCPNTIEHTI